MQAKLLQRLAGLTSEGMCRNCLFLGRIYSGPSREWYSQFFAHTMSRAEKHSTGALRKWGAPEAAADMRACQAVKGPCGVHRVGRFHRVYKAEGIEGVCTAYRA